MTYDTKVAIIVRYTIQNNKNPRVVEQIVGYNHRVFEIDSIKRVW